ncbi:MAG: carbohydrate ABC transporter permease [Lachnospiraceae bacterium]|nr:carbohydrate ABC transporter permease [Lachnospiraceae bacterium]
MAKKDNNVINRPVTRKKFDLFPILNGLFFLIFCLLIIIPMWKVIVDSFDLQAAYGMRLWPAKFGFDGYASVFRNPTFARPLGISFLTMISGTLLSLFITTLSAYVLIQYDMPGRNAFSMFLLFTMIFNGGLIPTYLALKSLGMLNTLWVVILPHALNVYNVVLMRNFFEGIPGSLFEAADIDGASPMQQFIKIALPLSKPALASIGLMSAVQFWNDYTSYKLYITTEKLYNFQMKLRQVVMSSDLPQQVGGATENTVRNAAIIVVILPFAILYPFLQKYFVKGVNIGAVKE